MLDVATRTAEECFIPYTVGGGMRSAADIRAMLAAGCDKISLNSAAVRDPELITQTSRIYGSQCIVVAIDARRVAGRRATAGRSSSTAAASTPGSTRSSGPREAERLGAGEILLTSMDCDGTKDGYDIAADARGHARRSTSPSSRAAERASSTTSPRSVIEADADAVLAASVFHFGEFTVRQVKEAWPPHGVPVRL